MITIIKRVCPNFGLVRISDIHFIAILELMKKEPNFRGPSQKNPQMSTIRKSQRFQRC